MESKDLKEKPRKISTTMIIFVACVFGLGIGLLSLNYWHATNCNNNRPPDQTEEYINAFNRRLLHAESQIHKNEILMNKVMHALESNLYKLEKKEYESLSKQSNDEAVRIALYLANHPAPPMPEFPLSSEYEDPEKLADVIDDVFGKASADDKTTEDLFAENAREEEEEKISNISDADAIKLCVEWKEKFLVVPGVSWGDLPYDLQQQWLHYSCDYHLKDPAEIASKGGSASGAGSSATSTTEEKKKTINSLDLEEEEEEEEEDLN